MRTFAPAPRRICAACVAGLLFTSALRSAETLLPAHEYRARLEHIAGALKSGNWSAARDEAQGLLGSRVRFATGTLGVDSSLLQPLADAPENFSAARWRPRLAQLIAALRSREGAPSAAALGPADAALLLAIQRQQQAAHPLRGGETGRLERPALPESMEGLWSWLGTVVSDALKTLGNALLRFIKWLANLLPNVRAPDVSNSWFGPFTLMLILIFLGITALLVLDLIRKHRLAALPAAKNAAARAPEQDADPTSRADREWEAYAQDLLRDNRAREAVRAYYHAILAALFACGVLHYRKGRTNWEYYRDLPRELPWRPAFGDSTQVFERVWYGKQASDEELYLGYAAHARRILAQVRPERKTA